MAERTISSATNVAGTISVPGDKSISHRQAIFSALASGRSVLTGFSSGADCQSTLDCLAGMGVPIRHEGARVIIEGVGLRGLQAPAAVLDAGNSGSTIRLLSGVLAAQTFSTSITGDASLRRRPMRRVIDPLTQMGARISSDKGKPPLVFLPPLEDLKPINYVLPVASAQVKSAILLAALYATGVTSVEEPQRTRDHTELGLTLRGVDIRRKFGRISLTGPVSSLPPIDCAIPGDASAAAFFLCAAAMLPDSDLTVANMSLNPTRTALLDVLRGMGAQVELLNVQEQSGELCGDVRVCGTYAAAGSFTPFAQARSSSASATQASLSGTSISGPETVALIDEIPVLAVLATAADGGIRFEDAGELRVKESDRIASIATNLRAMGAECEELPDGLFVPGPQQLHGALIHSYGDHRIAMGFAIAALRASGDTVIDDPDCASISFPEFYQVLDRVAVR